MAVAANAGNAVKDRLFFGGMTLMLAVVVFWGFAPSFYLRRVLKGTNVLTPGLILHGIVFTLWIALLVLQAALISLRRVRLHRRLGIIGVAVAVLMTVLAGHVAVSRATLPGAPPLQFLAIPLATVVVFPALFAMAIHFRHRAQIHKRLILLATCEVISAAVARLPGVAAVGPIGFFGGVDLFVGAMAIYDYAVYRRLNPATIFGGLFLVVSQPVRIWIGQSEWWLTFASWLTT